jgi:hypothetical protein
VVILVPHEPRIRQQSFAAAGLLPLLDFHLTVLSSAFTVAPRLRIDPVQLELSILKQLCSCYSCKRIIRASANSKTALIFLRQSSVTSNPINPYDPSKSNERIIIYARCHPNACTRWSGYKTQEQRGTRRD